MKEKKQSFLERLTGTHVIEGEHVSGNRGNVLSEKPWSPRLDAKRSAIIPSHTYVDPHAEKNEEEPVAPEENEEKENDDENGAEKDGEEASLAIDMYESDNELIIQCMIAGVMPDNLHVAITRESVTIRGKRVAPEGIPEGDYVERGLYWGPFAREITLPLEVDTESAEAVEKYGLLVIRLPKLNTSKTQELKVRSVE
ncbi:MAG: hypothetical protein A3D65_04210 [Candidatus Lloydbacteria bacterium RIFCSPHIGHO2_02_FULL_50_13]|uniref:SHSP domain-containing protein n=1 Tax=Candidatus Lloydbacteria bacterium RIFCSPHIGHO2_02_FULL_50_13 TaxID=1798661 RepID=A0A1G2DAK8_9BACT|nr:MAG: hypothetical protein A3D65_04210 [Candidatus Lloydbacteria bacterium RIFCSPHIGHO2_02_FULL_50_13]